MKKISTFPFLVIVSALLFACNSNHPMQKNDKTEAQQVSTNALPKKTIIVDVRTMEEWNNDGHAPCAVLIPLDELDKKIDSLRGFDAITVVCRSGSRAEQAKELLEEAGITSIENKGSWQNIQCDK